MAKKKGKKAPKAKDDATKKEDPAAVVAPPDGQDPA